MKAQKISIATLTYIEVAAVHFQCGCEPISDRIDLFQFIKNQRIWATYLYSYASNFTFCVVIGMSFTCLGRYFSVQADDVPSTVKLDLELAALFDLVEVALTSLLLLVNCNVMA